MSEPTDVGRSASWQRPSRPLYVTSHPTTVEAMQFTDLDSYLAIIEWMRRCGDTWALADEVRFSTPIMLYPGGPTGMLALQPTDWLVRNPARDGFWRLTNEQFSLFYEPMIPNPDEYVKDVMGGLQDGLAARASEPPDVGRSVQ